MTAKPKLIRVIRCPRCDGDGEEPGAPMDVRGTWLCSKCNGMGNIQVGRKPKPGLKLYIWDGFSPDYTGGLAFAIAGSQQEAERLVTKQRGTAPYNWGTLEIRPLTRRVARACNGGG